ncbi:hypothetical protein SD960_16810 [Flavobacterium sp. MMLR14_040]|uniref:hypothetical protein n=1 Tax=Flavobacterium sp. MMLR14_040 TaxID=3093843 RepID=UPI00298FB075|nr:hypothetical protein [Flavobacterium sp. MMLR14_040]MDW8851765.1 hypothetical protein [Flavobacterium sp. MMLR14_040]
MEENKNYAFSEDEWNACIKVLKTLKEVPFENPDNDLFAGLITKIHKNAKKNIRIASYSSKKQEDLQTSFGKESYFPRNNFSKYSTFSLSDKTKRS